MSTLMIKSVKIVKHSADQKQTGHDQSNWLNECFKLTSAGASVALRL